MGIACTRQHANGYAEIGSYRLKLKKIIAKGDLGSVYLANTPDRVSEVAVLAGVVDVDEPRGLALHLDAQPAVELDLALVEGPHSDAHLDAHND